MRALMVLAGLLFVATAASANTGGCAGGSSDPFFYVTTLGNDVMIHYQTATYADMLRGSSATASMGKSKDTITVVQTTAAVVPNGVPCATGVVGIADVPSGTHNVIWEVRSAQATSPLKSFFFTIQVPAAATVGPCSGGPADPFFSVTFGPLALHAESAVLMYHLGSLQVDGRHITVTERETVSGVPPPFPLPCQRETIPLPPLPPGTYDVTWQYYKFVGVPPPAAQSIGDVTQTETPVMTFDFTFTVSPPARPRAVRH